MSDTEDATVLGKRTRNGVPPSDEKPVAGNEQTEGHNDMDEDSDDDVGPMPMPAEQGNGAAKKKRKGALALNLAWCNRI